MICRRSGWEYLRRESRLSKSGIGLIACGVPFTGVSQKVLVKSVFVLTKVLWISRKGQVQPGFLGFSLEMVRWRWETNAAMDVSWGGSGNPYPPVGERV